MAKEMLSQNRDLRQLNIKPVKMAIFVLAAYTDVCN
jgi:hypothetical protein